MKKQNLLVLASIIAVSGLIVGQSALASPSGKPSPDTNATNAVFNSLSLINSSGKEYLKVKSGDPLGMHTVMESPDGYIYLNDSLALTNGNIVVDRTIYAKQSISSGDDIVAKGRLMSQGLNGYGGGLWLDNLGAQFVGDSSDATPLTLQPIATNSKGQGYSSGFYIDGAWRFVVDSLGQMSNPSKRNNVSLPLAINDDLTVSGKSTLNNTLTIANPDGYGIGLEVAGRIRSGNGQNGTGGMWVGNGPQFVGSKDANYVGLYNNGHWGVVLNDLGATTISGLLVAGQGILAEGGLIASKDVRAPKFVSTGEIEANGKITTYAGIQASGNITSGGGVSAQRFIGRCNFKSPMVMGASNTDCQDVAEVYPASEKTEAGDLLMLDSKNPGQMKLATREGQLTGVVSTSAGVILSANGPVVSDGNNEDYITDKQTLLVLTGKAPVKVNNENGAIKVGDYITASSVAGVGMKANAGDQVVGVAMENFDSAKQGSILILSDKSGALSMVRDELSKKINSLEARLSQLEKLLVK